MSSAQTGMDVSMSFQGVDIGYERNEGIFICWSSEMMKKSKKKKKTHLVGFDDPETALDVQFLIGSDCRMLGRRLFAKDVPEAGDAQG